MTFKHPTLHNQSVPPTQFCSIDLYLLCIFAYLRCLLHANPPLAQRGRRAVYLYLPPPEILLHQPTTPPTPVVPTPLLLKGCCRLRASSSLELLSFLSLPYLHNRSHHMVQGIKPRRYNTVSSAHTAGIQSLTFTLQLLGKQIILLACPFMLTCPQACRLLH